MSIGLKRIGDSRGKDRCITDRRSGAQDSVEGYILQSHSRGQAHEPGDEKLVGVEFQYIYFRREVVDTQDVSCPEESADHYDDIAAHYREVFGDTQEIEPGDSDDSAQPVEKRRPVLEENAEEGYDDDVKGCDEPGLSGIYRDEAQLLQVEGEEDDDTAYKPSDPESPPPRGICISLVVRIVRAVCAVCAACFPPLPGKIEDQRHQCQHT